MQKHGYDTCASCHVSPVGGGSLTAYGRRSAEELLSSWSSEGQSNVGHVNYAPIEWLAVGGDFRQVNDIKMQKDFELGLKWSSIWFVGSVGYYNDSLWETRRHYVEWVPEEDFSLRVGKFIVAYGLNHPDHTAVNRSAIGLGQGQESYNVEASTKGKYFEIFSTYIAAKKEGLSSYDGIAHRVSLFPFPFFHVGGSYRYDTDEFSNSDMYGLFTTANLGRRLFLMSDWNRLRPKDIDTHYTKLSYEPWQGVNLFMDRNDDLNGIGLDLFPIPHLELLGKVDKNRRLLLVHYYF